VSASRQTLCLADRQRRAGGSAPASGARMEKPWLGN